MKRHIFFGSVVATIILLWGASWYLIPKLYNAQSLEAGTFGDMFGAVNSLFSGLAFAGLIYTITVQRQELALQREAITMQTEELRMQREETARSADQLEGQKNLLDLQMAMGIVNDLIQTKNRRAEEMQYYLNGECLTGYHGISIMVSYNQYVGAKKPTEDSGFLQSYLNTFFFILSFIAGYKLQNEQKDLLDDLVNMNTTDDEVRLIYMAAEQNQHRLMMLKIHGFYPRHQKLIDIITKPS
ncbi:hypothetical protein M3629_06210 [Paenibacillus polysaccharolyticus]|uniref:hypothetical protein n=1 Tax=Paenibacillus polysaccharolyticus TaxID=582692 RepID=UPI00203B58E7|nr:hypothetical protein [Paenibacillus polysaccharolyticus]MCM3132370.1 hypothetical protein [Paenibacillus polysaccharolyticus]